MTKPTLLRTRIKPVRGDRRQPRARLAPEKVAVPMEPLADPAEEGPLYDEQQVLRTEILMAKGIRDRRQLMALLDVGDYRRMDKYIDRVNARWEMIGAANNLNRHRGEGLQRLDLVESEMWSLISNTEDDKVKIVTLRSILEVHAQRTQLLGLTQRVVERMTGTDGVAVVEFATRVSTHDKMSRLAQRMLQMIEERTGTKVIDHES